MLVRSVTFMKDQGDDQISKGFSETFLCSPTLAVGVLGEADMERHTLPSLTWGWE